MPQEVRTSPSQLAGKVLTYSDWHKVIEKYRYELPVMKIDLHKSKIGNQSCLNIVTDTQKIKLLKSKKCSKIK